LKDGAVREHHPRTWTRRGLIAAAGVGVLAIGGSRLRLRAQQSSDLPSDVDAVRKLVGDRPLHRGRVHLDLPESAENARAVPIAVNVDSPMSEADHVTALHVIAPGASDPVVASYRFTPDCGRAFVEFRARLADGAQLIVLAVMSDGAVYKAERTVAIAATDLNG
jgi:sulfur-oxidizing protein SoxY